MNTDNRNDIQQMMELLMEDAIPTPVALLPRDDVYEPAKIMYSVVLGSSLATNTRDFNKKLKNLPLSEIQAEFHCSVKVAEEIKNELLKLLPYTENIMNNQMEGISFE